jgi:hypothetical protein
VCQSSIVCARPGQHIPCQARPAYPVPCQASISCAMPCQHILCQASISCAMPGQHIPCQASISCAMPGQHILCQASISCARPELNPGQARIKSRPRQQPDDLTGESPRQRPEYFVPRQRPDSPTLEFPQPYATYSGAGTRESPRCKGRISTIGGGIFTLGK